MKFFDHFKALLADKSARAAAKKTLSLMLLAFCLCCVKLCAEDTSPAEAQVMREKFVAESKKHVGAPYVLGAVGPDTFDCSGLVYYTARESIKKQLPRTAKALYNYCRIVPDKEKEVGDLLFFKTNNTAPITHVGIYIGNNQFISAISDGPNTGVIISSLKQDYWKPKYVACGQFMPSGKAKAKGGSSGDSDDFEEEDFEDDQGGTAGSVAKSGKDGKGSQVKFKGSSFYNPDAQPLDALVGDASLFCDWSLFSPNAFMIQWRGIDLHTNIRYAKWPLEPGFGIGLRFNYGMGVFQIPLMFSATINDYFRFYAGPVFTIGRPRMMVTGEEVQASIFPGIIGISVSTPSFNIGQAKCQVVQDISYTIFNNFDNSALSFTNSVSAGLVFFTGIRVTLGASSVFKK
jgi:hypothetical protein